VLVYHSSMYEFDKPSIEMIIKNISNHANGLLGLWFSTTNGWQKNFGTYTYEFEIPDDARALEMDITDFVSMCNKTEDFLLLREEFLDNEYEVLNIRERTGKVEMGILLNLDVEMKRI